MLGLYVGRGEDRTRRFELAKTQILIGSCDQNDLVLRDGDVSPFHCALTFEHGAWWLCPDRHREARVAVNGAPVAGKRVVVDKDRIQIGCYAVVLDDKRTWPQADPVERDLVAAIVDGDDASRLVYADWLEERGDDRRAEFLRLQQIAFAEGTNAKDPQTQRHLWRLRVLADDIDIVWRQQVGRVVFAGCTRAEGECPGEWSRLAATEDPRVRRCGTCNHSVHYCRSSREAYAQAQAGRKTATDIRDYRLPYEPNRIWK